MTDLPGPSAPQPQRPQRWGLWATLGWSVCILGIFVISQTLVALGAIASATANNPEADPMQLAQEVVTSGWVLSLATLISTPLCMGLIALFIRCRRSLTIKRYLELQRPNWRSLLLWCVLTLGLIYGIDQVKAMIDRPLTPSFTTDIYNTAQFIPLLYLAVAVAAPLFEEFFFRGFIFQGLRHSCLGVWGAILISSALWAAIHQQYDQYDMAGIFVFGVVLAIAQIRTQSLYIPIAMHALNNFLALSQVALS